MDLNLIHQCISFKYYGELPGYSRGVGAGLNGDVPIGGFRARPRRIDNDDLGTAALRGPDDIRAAQRCHRSHRDAAADRGNAAQSFDAVDRFLERRRHRAFNARALAPIEFADATLND